MTENKALLIDDRGSKEAYNSKAAYSLFSFLVCLPHVVVVLFFFFLFLQPYIAHFMAMRLIKAQRLADC